VVIGMYLERFKERDIMYLDRTERRIAAITPQMRRIHTAQIIQDAYNDFKREVNDDSRQVTLFYHIFKNTNTTWRTRQETTK
jgi:hypothetical protein